MKATNSGQVDARVEVPSPRQRRSTFGKIGMILSLVPLAILAVRIILRPGWGSPIYALGGLLTLASTPAALVLCIVGLLRDGRKVYAIIGTVVAGLWVLLLAGSRLMVGISRITGP